MLVIPAGVAVLLVGRLVGRRGGLGGVRVRRRLYDEDDAAVELCARLVAPGGAVHETRLAVADGLDERRIDTLAGDVRLHGVSAMLRERLVVPRAALRIREAFDGDLGAGV